MKRLALVLCFPAVLAFGADLANVKNVYVLRMSKGMDQYLANRLTNQRLFQIVTDPKIADAILTDQIGEGFEAKLRDLYPPPPSPEPEEKEEAEQPEKPAKNAKGDEPPSTMSMISETAGKLPPMTVNSSFSRAKGTLFLVDAKTKEVVWSTYNPPKDASSRQMDRTANDIVSRLKHDLNKK